VIRFRVLDGPYDPHERMPADDGPEAPYEAQRPTSSGPRAAAADRPEPSEGVERRLLELTVAEALLGGRVEVTTASGKVRMVIPPCTSSGQTFRLRGRGQPGPSGAQDLMLEVRIITPSSLDPASRALIEEFARLHPELPER
jgi:hypothetical protein